MREIQITEHRCERVLDSERDRDEYLKIRSFNETWVLHKFHYACEKCVYDGEAQYEGELMSVFDVSINFCPYCGLRLNENFASQCNIVVRDEKKSEHQCSAIENYNKKFPHVGFSFDTDAVWKICYDDGCWLLEKHSIATEKMIEANEADKGELIFWSGTNINFCPFCGDKL
jgi:hypothetical protein